MPAFTPRQLILLALLTLIWGLNWPVMKLGVQNFPPLSFRVASLGMGLALIFAAARFMHAPLAIARRYWAQVAWLTLFNTLTWYGLTVIAIPMLSSGRAAILGYTMPVFSAVLGSLFWVDETGAPLREAEYALLNGTPTPESCCCCSGTKWPPWAAGRWAWC